MSSDVPAIVAVVNAAYAIEKFVGGMRTNDADVVERMQTGDFLVAEDEIEAGALRIVACVFVEVRRERGYFGMLGVSPAMQRRGLGQLMIEAAETRCRTAGCRWMDIAVASLRPELPPFYRRMGYSETGIEEFRPPSWRPLKPGFECHIIIMSKQL